MLTREQFIERFSTGVHLLDCAGKSANLIGGCCGTTPDYIRNLRRRMRQEGHPD
jgi:methionine synthase I (cobalamin-dependent)